MVSARHDSAPLRPRVRYPRQAMTSPRYGSLSVRTECKHCGAPLPLDAPALEVSCTQCSGRVSVPAETWGAMLTDLDDQIDLLAEGQGRVTNEVIEAQKIVYELKREMPRCEKCGTPLEVAAWPVGTSQNFCCTGCGDPASTEPVPPWLGQTAPSAKQLYRIDPDLHLGGANGVALPVPSAPKPVALACPSCGAGLRISADHPRLTPCEHCGADVYLPDAVWHQLHPVRVVRPFYVRFEGVTRRERRQREKAERNKREGVEWAERAKREELRSFMEQHAKGIVNASGPEIMIAGLTMVLGPFLGPVAVHELEWFGHESTATLLAMGVCVFVLGAAWMFNAVSRDSRRYARKVFLPKLRELMARNGYSVAVVKETARAELGATIAKALLKAVDELNDDFDQE